ncbi:MAG: hypothetical protein PVJ55_07265 [Anaerolineae bacterium]|jgi:hypothetical protein
MADSREKAQAIVGQSRPGGWLAAAVNVASWLLSMALITRIIVRMIRR